MFLQVWRRSVEFGTIFFALVRKASSIWLQEWFSVQRKNYWSNARSYMYFHFYLATINSYVLSIEGQKWINRYWTINQARLRSRKNTKDKLVYCFQIVRWFFNVFDLKFWKENRYTQSSQRIFEKRGWKIKDTEKDLRWNSNNSRLWNHSMAEVG